MTKIETGAARFSDIQYLQVSVQRKVLIKYVLMDWFVMLETG